MNKKNYTTSINNLNPNFITGFCDAEASFGISIIKDSRYNLGYNIKTVFSIHLHSKDIDSLYLIQRFFNNVGGVNIHKKTAIYQVIKQSELLNIINHFNKYSFRTKKSLDFELFKKAYYIMNNKQHLTKIGFEQILSLRASINKGLSDKLMNTFPNIIPAVIPKVTETPLVSNDLDIKY